LEEQSAHAGTPPSSEPGNRPSLENPLTIRKVHFRNRFVALPVGFSHSIDSTATPTSE
jgi:hypothetical protein